MTIVKQSNELSSSESSNQLLKAIVEIQGAFIEESDIRASFGRMLDCLLEVTASEYGFLGEVLYDSENQPYLLTHALTDISWDAKTKKLYDESMAKGFEFHNLNTLFGVTLATAEVVISNDPSNDPRSGGLPQGHPGMNSYIGMPIMHRHEMVGMLGIANREGGYNKSIAEMLNPLLLTAGAMINSIRIDCINKKIEGELQSKHKLLNGIIHNITDALIITDHSGVIMEVNAATEKMFGYYSQELVGRKITKLIVKDDINNYESIIKEYILSGKRELIDKSVETIGAGKKKLLIDVELSINDIKLDDKKLFVNIFHDISERKAQEKMLEDANAQLKELSETDELTGLPNRRFFEINFSKDYNRCRKDESNLGLALIDIDYFKSYNDNYGHLEGDRCLALIGSMMRDYFRRDCEFPARIGGEEFAIVMTHMTEKQCIDSINKFREIIIKENIKHEYSVENFLTISVGLAMRTSKMSNTDMIYAGADKALYEAKGNGRNQLIVIDN